MKDEKALLAGGHKGGDVPLVELVHHLQVHVRGPGQYTTHVLAVFANYLSDFLYILNIYVLYRYPL